MSLIASIIIPTRERPDYLRVALASIAPQAAQIKAEVLVIDDGGPSPERRGLAEGLGARYRSHPGALGLNVARNTGVEQSTGDLVVFVDDDVQVSDGWLSALVSAARAHPAVAVFTGPIRPCLEGHPPRTCGREGSPITAVDLGPEDTQTRYAWGANMAIRRDALERIGPFDVTLSDGGDEQEWQDRLYRSEGGGALYVAAAAVLHRRTPSDARLRRLMRAAAARGRAARRFDSWRSAAPPIATELLTLAGCVGHVLRYRCPAGMVMVAHSFGRLRQGLGERLGANHQSDAVLSEGSPADDFLSGNSGTVGGLNAIGRGTLDGLYSCVEITSGARGRLARAARRYPPKRRVLVLGVERPERRGLAAAMRSELARSRHEVELHFRAPGGMGKFENLNLLLAEHPPDLQDWLLIVDDDVLLPRGFLDRMLFLAERFSLDLAQPAHRLRSHAAWEVTRRRAGCVAHETRFVEIGPINAFARSTFSRLLPFPPLSMGWGLDLHWGALAREHGWRCGVLDALAINHAAAPAASSYSRDAAVSEARSFLAAHPYIPASEAQQTLAVHRRW